MMERHVVEVRTRWPGNRLPITVILDDPMPCRNSMWYLHPDEGHVAEVPHSFTERFAAVIEYMGAAGKFSVIPCPGETGRVDEGIPGVAHADLEQFLRLVRERIAPRWDICPELLTHNRALALATMRPLAEREDAWAAHQDEASLTAYISRALQILRNAGLAPNGVTSPWSFGCEVEQAYAGAIATALRDVCGVKLGWYFLHCDARSPSVPPRLMRLDAAAGTALPETLLSADGSGGRLAELYADGSPLVFHTHWQSLFSNGSGAGLDAFEKLCRRINNTWGQRVRWTSARELATGHAAAVTTRLEADAAGQRLTFTAPFACPAFTFALPVPAGARKLYSDGVLLEQVGGEDAPLDEWSWRYNAAAGEALICVPLRDGLELAWL